MMERMVQSWMPLAPVAFYAVSAVEVRASSDASVFMLIHRLSGGQFGGVPSPKYKVFLII